MKIIHLPAQKGKTTELIKLASQPEGAYKLIVCQSLQESNRIFHMARDLGYEIPMPISYEEFLKGEYYNKNINSFLIDNADMLINYISRNVKIEAMSITKEENG